MRCYNDSVDHPIIGGCRSRRISLSISTGVLRNQSSLHCRFSLYFITARQRRAQNGYPKLEAVSVQFSNYQNWDLLDTLRDVDGFTLTTNKPALPPTEEDPVVRALASIAQYPRNAITAEPGAFDQRDIKMFSVPIF